MMKMSSPPERRAAKSTSVKGSASALALATALVVPGAAQAQYINWEYATSSPQGPAQPNLAQIGVNSALHTFVLDAGADLGSVTIAILDGKVDVTHIDLATFTQDPSGPAKSSVTFIPSYGGRFRNSSNHATHVAGTAAANRNNAALVGVDPFAKILSIPVFDDRGWIANDLGKAALDAALAAGARVVNMSYGSTTKGAIS